MMQGFPCTLTSLTRNSGQDVKIRTSKNRYLYFTGSDSYRCTFPSCIHYTVSLPAASSEKHSLRCVWGRAKSSSNTLQRLSLRHFVFWHGCQYRPQIIEGQRTALTLWIGLEVLARQSRQSSDNFRQEPLRRVYLRENGTSETSKY